jgi:hypothetical protein
MHLMAEMSREDVIERLRWIDREAQDAWVLIPAERETALRHAIAAVADLQREGEQDQFCTCGHRREAHHQWGQCHGMRCKCTGFVLHDTLVDDLRADLSRYKALHMDTLVALREKVSAMREQPGTPTIGQIERLIESFIAEARALKEAPDGK